VARTLLLTNDFPPRPGGIQIYLHTLATRLPADELVVYAPSWQTETAADRKFDAAQPFTVVRHSGSLMTPTPRVLKKAKEIIASEGCDTVWFGAAAPLALLAPALRNVDMQRIVASTHGHEIGWSMLPAARQALRRIGATTDVLTFVSKYARGRCAAAFGPHAALEYLPSGVDTQVYRPDSAARAELRKRYGLADRPTVVCVSRLVPRKGQDTLIRALPLIRRHVPDAALLLVGSGRYADRLRKLAIQLDVAEHVMLTGMVSWEELPGHFAAGDVFAMPCRTRGYGLDVEGLGIVFLEASACGLPVIAGRDGGAPETVRRGVTGQVVDGRAVDDVARRIAKLLADPERARRMGEAGRAWVTEHWQWDPIANRLAQLLNCDAAVPANK